MFRLYYITLKKNKNQKVKKKPKIIKLIFYYDCITPTPLFYQI